MEVRLGQASQGPLGPSRSEGSRQAINTELRSLDLRNRSHGRHQPQHQCRQHHCALPGLGLCD